MTKETRGKLIVAGIIIGVLVISFLAPLLFNRLISTHAAPAAAIAPASTPTHEISVMVGDHLAGSTIATFITKDFFTTTNKRIPVDSWMVAPTNFLSERFKLKAPNDTFVFQVVLFDGRDFRWIVPKGYDDFRIHFALGSYDYQVPFLDYGSGDQEPQRPYR